jgi:adenylate cyclase
VVDRPIDVRLPGPADPAKDVLSAVRDRLAGRRDHPLRDVAFDLHLDRDELERLFRAAGRLRDDDRYGDDDRAYADDLAELLTRFDLPVLERMLRLHQRAATTVAVNQLALLQNDPRLAPLLDPDADVPESITQVIADDAERLLPLTQRLLVADHREALIRLLDTEVVLEASRTASDAVELAVGFVDLVGFTRLSAAVDPAGVGEVLAGFEDGVHHAASSVGEVLVVKFIGDAAMLVSGDLDRLVDVLLRVVDDPLPSGDEVERRAGAAAGPVAVRDGDYIGNAVNTAARLTDLARPGSVLVEEPAAARLAGDWPRKQLRPRKLKGLGRARPYRVWRPTGT